MSDEVIWEEQQLHFMEMMNGQIKKLRNKSSGKMIELADDGKVIITDKDGNEIKSFNSLKKALKFNWRKFYGENE